MVPWHETATVDIRKEPTVTLSFAVTAATLTAAVRTSPAEPTPAAVTVCAVLLLRYLASRSVRMVLPG